MLVSLTRLLRQFLESEAGHEVSLSAELRTLEPTLELERLRPGERFGRAAFVVCGRSRAAAAEAEHRSEERREDGKTSKVENHPSSVPIAVRRSTPSSSVSTGRVYARSAWRARMLPKRMALEGATVTMMRVRAVGAMVLGGVLGCSAAAPSASPALSATPAAAPAEGSVAAAADPGVLPSDAQVQAILDARVGEFADHYGIVVGLLDAGGKRVVSRGSLSKESSRAVDGGTLFELGSITKVFTALLLVIAVERGEVGLDDPVAKHLPPGTKVPSLNGRSITLRDLATHTSGLPRTPTNLVSTNSDDPYAGYTVEMLYAYLATLELEREPGSKYAYSNLGAALLARALMVRTGKSYAELVQERISEPLGLRNTWVAVPTERRPWLALGHTGMLQPAPYRTRDAMVGNGGVFSSADDLLTFLSASMGLVETPLASAFATIAMPQKALDDPNRSVGLGWHMWKRDGRDVVWHNGGTAGFGTYAAFDRDKRQAVVVLSNVSTEAGVDDLGMHLVAAGALEPAGSPRVTPALPHAIDPGLLDRYVGEYGFAAGTLMNITRDGDHLSFQLPGKPKLPLYPVSEQVFRMAQASLQFSFETDASGKALAVVMTHGDKNARLPRHEASAESPASSASRAEPARQP